jgi:hypothetical protein
MRNTTAAIVLTLAVGTTIQASEIVPTEAISLIERVHTAAVAKDYAYLKSAMVDDFFWGHDVGQHTSEGAIDAWHREPMYLEHLERATSTQCARTRQLNIECAEDAGKKYRAGFNKTLAGWRMVYFVSGD